MTLIGKSCGNCGRSVPLTATVGSRCPHCGVYFGGERSRTIGGGGSSGSDDGEALLGCGCLVILGLIGWGCYAAINGANPQPRPTVANAPYVAPKPADTNTAVRVEQDAFWPGNVLRSENGHLTSDKYIPLRALARRPNVSMFQSQGMKYPEGVVGVMQPWRPYYIFERTDGALLLGDSARSARVDRRWVNETDCFCWTTRECINIQQPTQIYTTKEDARNGANPLSDSYVYRYDEHFESPLDTGAEGLSSDQGQGFRISSLPVLHRDEDGLWCFVRPEGDEHGYQVCWVKWDGEDPRIRCRIRAARREYEEYLIGMRRLMIEWKNPEKKADAKRRLYDHALASMTRAETLGQASLNKISARREGIPKLTGFLEKPIESELQYESVTRRATGLIRLSNSDIWDVNEVAYIEVEKLP